MGPNHLNPLSNQLSYAIPAEKYDPHRRLNSNAKLQSLTEEALGRESAHDLDPPPKKQESESYLMEQLKRF